ncbi:DUF5131 family protein [Candidatus Aenigmatarchaeota archaeon]
MAEKSSIEWTDSTWNPTTGCTKVSSGCANCYAERLAFRLHKIGVKKYRNRFRLTIHKDVISMPLKWKVPKTIFVNSMSDLFHKDVSYDFIKRVFDVMKEAHWHTFQLLTKRPERMLEFTKKYYKKPISNLWLGTSIENSSVKNRINILKKTPSKIRFISFEPLIGPIGKLNLSKIHWVVVGGESGWNHRPIEKDWVREIRDQCIKQKVPFFFKQWGGNTPKSGGRKLDRKYWNEYPATEKN